MRKVVSTLFITLDGVTQDPGDWQAAFDDEMGEAMNSTLQTTDAVLLGRTTYQEWVQYWPHTTEDQDFATWINKNPKYVASTTLDSVEDWENSTLLKGDLATAIGELKATEGGTIGVAGSPGLVRSLIDENLLDELVLLIHPVVAGGGRQKLFADDAALKNLELVSAQPTSSGTIIATYRTA